MNNHSGDHLSARIGMLTEAISGASSDRALTQSYIERGHCFELLGDTAKSVSDFLSALDTATDNSDIVHVRSMIALALAKKGQKEQALFWATGAVDQDSRNAEGYHTLGIICDVCGYLNVAIEALQRAIGIEPSRWDSFRVLGSCLRENGQIEESVAMLSGYVASNPVEPIGLCELGWSLHVAGGAENMRVAKEMYERALECNPGSDLRAMAEGKLRDLHSVLGK